MWGFLLPMNTLIHKRTTIEVYKRNPSQFEFTVKYLQGYLIFDINRRTNAVSLVYIHAFKKFRGQGFAKQMIEEMLKRLKPTGTVLFGYFLKDGRKLIPACRRLSEKYCLQTDFPESSE